MHERSINTALFACALFACTLSACEAGNPSFPPFDSHFDGGLDSSFDAQISDTQARDVQPGDANGDGSSFDSAAHDGSGLDAAVLDGGVPAFAQELLETYRQTTNLECSCFFESYGFSSLQACVDRLSKTSNEERCIAEIFGDQSAYASCEASAVRAKLSCDRNASCNASRRNSCRSAFASAHAACANESSVQSSAVLSAIDVCLNGPKMPGCASEALTVPGEFEVRTDANGNDYRSSCGGDAADRGYSFTPNENGWLEISTTGSSDTTVTLFRGCDAQAREFSCAHETGYSRNTRLETRLNAGETYNVEIDGASNIANGTVQVRTRWFGDDACSATGTAEAGAETRFEGSLDGTRASFDSQCGSPSGIDAAHTFRAVQGGHYVATLQASTFVPLLAIRESCAWSSQERGCAVAASDNVATVFFDAAPQQTLVFVAKRSALSSGTTGLNYNLAIRRLPDDACPVSTISSTVVGNNREALDDFTPSCSFGGGRDVAYNFQAPSAGIYRFALVSANFSAVLSLRSACQGGNEMGCMFEPNPTQNQITRSMNAGESVLVVVDGSSPGAFGDFEISVVRIGS